MRRQTVEEMHLRRWPPVRFPCLIIQMLRIVDDSQREAEKAKLGDAPPFLNLFEQDNPRHRAGRFADNIAFVWEQHSEASCVSLFVNQPSRSQLENPEQIPGLAEAVDWLQTLPGQAVRATQIFVVEDEAVAQQLVPAMDFPQSDLVSCHIGPEDGARIWSDFRIGPDGFGRLLVAANGLPQGDLSRLIQRTQELGNYRNLALLGLPIAQKYWGELKEIEISLNDLAADVAASQIDDDVLLDRVTSLSLELNAISTATNFRLGATAAYAQLVEERLADVAPRTIPGFPSLADFNQRRLMPAVRTCASQKRREWELSQRADRFSSLLQTRVETRIEHQNAQMLVSMHDSANRQLRLQQMAESFSIIALSYYLIGLLAYVLKGLGQPISFLDDAQLVALLVPACLLFVWLGLRSLKRRALEVD